MNPLPPPAPASGRRNDDMLQELIDCGMELARAAAKKARQMLSAPDADTGDAKARTRGPDPTQLFLRLWTSIRQSITLQARITSAPKTAAAPAAAVDQLARELARSRKEEARFGTTLSPLSKMSGVI